MNNQNSEYEINWLSQWFTSLQQSGSLYDAQPVSATTELAEGLALLGASLL